jgi:hypothetical protein
MVAVNHKLKSCSYKVSVNGCAGEFVEEGDLTVAIISNNSSGKG